MSEPLGVNIDTADSIRWRVQVATTPTAQERTVGAVFAERPDRSGRAPGTGRDEPQGSDGSVAAPTDAHHAHAPRWWRRWRRKPQYRLVGYVHKPTFRTQGGAPLHWHDVADDTHLALYEEVTDA